MKKLIILTMLLLIGSGLKAQTGLPPHASIQSSGIDNINIGNLNIEMEIPITHVASRGFSFDPKLIYNSLIYTRVGSPAVWSPVQDALGVASWGWNTLNQTSTGTFDYSGHFRCVANDGSNQWTYSYSNLRATDASGVVHHFTFSADLAEDPDTYPECGDSSVQYTTQTLRDATGFTLQVEVMGGPSPLNGLALTLFSPSGFGVGSLGQVSDKNGNWIGSTTPAANETDYQDSKGGHP